MAGIFDLTGFLKPVVSKLADYIPDPTEKAKAAAQAETEILQFVNTQATAQLAVDQAEASNKSLFVAGWRPAVGWVCASALAWSTVGVPLANWFLMLVHPNGALLPTVPMGDLMPILMGMLGMGGMRTIEKLKGAAGTGS